MRSLREERRQTREERRQKRDEKREDGRRKRDERREKKREEEKRGRGEERREGRISTEYLILNRLICKLSFFTNTNFMVVYFAFFVYSSSSIPVTFILSTFQNSCES
jgi:hypothetical protein